MKSLSELVIDALSKTKLFEMAMDRRQMRDKIDNILQQVIENWCLVKYCYVSGDKENLVKHWEYELWTHMTKIAGFELKKASTSAKLKLVQELFKMYDLDTKPNICVDWCVGKFADEDIPSIYNSEIGISFTKNINKLYAQLVCGDASSIRTYITSI